MTIIQLPEPIKRGGMPLYETLTNRKSCRKIATQDLSMEELSNILWCAYGYNREGRRTAPSSHNSQEFDLYVAIKKGTYLYNPEDHSLELKFDEDLRALCGLQDFVASAPLTIIFVANRDKIKGKDERGVTETIYVDTGFISQNIYLYCASESLANVVRAMIDKEALSKKLHLSDNQEITLAHTIGRFPPRE